ncbi:unnamed protein product [Chrysoparadoxa australica]
MQSAKGRVGLPAGGGHQVDERGRLRDDRRRKEKERERAEKERARKEHARKVLEEQKIQKARRKWQKNSEFLCTLKFRNNLPDPPLGPYFLEIPLDFDKYMEYKPTSLETNYKWELHCERDLGVDIDIADPRNYMVPANPPALHKDDEALLNWNDTEDGAGNQREDLSRAARRRNVDVSVPWLKKTVYLTNDPFDPVHKFKTERQVQLEAERQLDSELKKNKVTDRVAQVLQTFADANGKKKVEHPTNKELAVEWVLPVLPEATLWGNTYTHLSFDLDPLMDNAIPGSNKNRKRRRTERAVVNQVRQVKNKNGDEFITGSYLLPRDRGSGDEGEEAKEDNDWLGPGPGRTVYEWAKDYAMTVQDYTHNRTDSNPHLIFIVDPQQGVASYCKLSAKVELSKHSAKSSVLPEKGHGAVLQRRGTTREEKKQMREKLERDLLVKDEWGNMSDEEAGKIANGGGMGRSFEGDDIPQPFPESEGSNIAVKGTDSEGTELSLS